MTWNLSFKAIPLMLFMLVRYNKSSNTNIFCVYIYIYLLHKNTLSTACLDLQNGHPVLCSGDFMSVTPVSCAEAWG